ncbi:hypothetical protein HK096_007864, partial [Nowakowskiella sp. JEL0078]
MFRIPLVAIFFSFTHFIVNPTLAQTSKDACGVISSVLVPYNDAVFCLDSFPTLSTTLKNQIVDTTLTFLNLYPYYDVISNSPEQRFPSKLNLKDRLNTIRQNVYNTERAFHEDITKVYIDMKDAHSSYFHCFMNFYWSQPWSIIAEYPNSKTKLNSANNWFRRYRPLLVDTYVQEFKNKLGYDPKDYLNATVLEIDGQNAVDFTSALSNQVSAIGVKDPNGRFNSMISKSTWEYGKFVIKDGYLSVQRNVPMNSSRKYKLKLQNGTNVDLTVPWFMTQTFTNTTALYSSRQEFYELYCLRSEIPKGTYKIDNSTSKATRRQLIPDVLVKRDVSDSAIPQEYMPDPKSVADRLEKTKLTVQNGLKFATSQNKGQINLLTPSLITQNNYTAFYGISKRNTGIWVFPTILPSGIRLTDGTVIPVTQSEIDTWLDSIVLGLEYLQTHGYTNLIIDVGQNVGGYICISQFLARLLFTDIQMPVFDMRSSELLSTLAQASGTTSRYYSPTYKNPLFGSPTSWYMPRDSGPTNTPGNFTQQYKSTMCDATIAASISAYLNNTKLTQNYWSPQNISVLSDGTCGSACSFITRALVEQKKVNAYVYGGLVDDGSNSLGFPWCGFDGGPVAKESDVRADVVAMSSKLPVVKSSTVIVPGTPESWVNLIAAESLTTLPLAVNWSLPVSATYGIYKLDRMTEWFYEPATKVVNIQNTFAERESL